ncbi:MAG: glycosyltransferase, partial [Ignavibacteriae bacterium]|nr:glycosyltransferase [Ignavibacteriota bacterium]
MLTHNLAVGSDIKNNEILEPNLFKNNIPIPFTEKVGCAYYVLPAYNEEESLPNLLKRIGDLNISHDTKIKVIVVNDGSSDQTSEVASKSDQNLQLTIVNHEKNMGLGQAVQTGIKEALSQANDNDIVVIMDADDTHDVTLLDEMISQIEDGADITIASRFVDGGDDASAPMFRRMLSRGASVIFKTILPLNSINDFTSGYRGYRVRLLRKASVHFGETLVNEQGFACMVELLLKLRHWSPKIVEIPFELRYDRKLGESKLKLSKTIFQYIKL